MQRDGGRGSRKLGLAARIGLGGLAAAAAVFVGALAEAKSYRVVFHEARLLPAGTEPIRLLHLSDLHYRLGQHHLARFVSELAELEPDLVISTGDILAGDAGFEELMAALAPLLEVPGAFVFGSNDYFGPTRRNPLGYLVPRLRSSGRGAPLDWRRLRDSFLANGWVDLTNRRSELLIGGRRVELRGTDDAHIRLDNYDRVAGPAAAGVELTLGVTHAPYRRVIDAMADDGLGLVLAGHTHGGQVCLPNGRALVTNCDLDPALAKGLHLYSSDSGAAGWLHVCAGLGTSPNAPYRLFCRPEACVIDLLPDD